MAFVELLADPHVWASFLALSAMEIVLGIDNVVFISVMVSRLPKEQQVAARRIGLLLAFVFRVIMLSFITWFIHMTMPIFSIGEYSFSWRDLVLLADRLDTLPLLRIQRHEQLNLVAVWISVARLDGLIGGQIIG